MPTSEMFDAKGKEPVLEPLDDRTETMSLSEAFKDDREPTVEELASLPETLSHAPADFFKKVRDIGPYFGACLLLAYYAKAVGGDETRVLPADLQARLKGAFRKDDDFNQYITRAYTWYGKYKNTAK